MADVIKKSTNKWSKGLVMDFSPENTNNEVLTHALNATLLTFNGNELSLQNDMGNARVETAYLPEGYMPVGTCEYGGIIYIVSYNPLENKSQIGCFPSPERNVSNLEMGKGDVNIKKEDFVDGDGNISHNSKYVLLRDDNLNPGDKFIVRANSTVYNEKLKDLFNENGPIGNPILSLSIVSIEDSGKITYLNSDLKQYSKGGYKYHIIGSDHPTTQDQDIDNYRSVLSSGYNVFKSKTSGKLAILAELVMIDSYAVTHSLKPRGNEGEFDIIIHTDITPQITEENNATAPKVAYYYLKNSQGILQTFNENGEEFRKYLFTDDRNATITGTKLSDIYTSTSGTDLFGDAVLNTIDFQFPQISYYSGVFDETTYSYPDVKLASIKLPTSVVANGLDLPFKYDYTLVPCMEYGKLDHLAVSNTVDFSKLHAFNKSEFTTWKYHIDGDQLRLTFGADVYDTYETNKVNGLVLEFYDLWGFAGSLEITDKKSYSGVFTKVISLNTLGALSKKRIVESNYSSNFSRNIKIEQKAEVAEGESPFVFNNKDVEYNNVTGWQYSDGGSFELENNDCGTLYSNILYGVKAYLRRDNGDAFEFIEKGNFFLYTIPIYNDYYYTVNNFNGLEYPQLDFILTYKLEDSGNQYPYTSKTITRGYNAEDLELRNKYLNGNYDDESKSLELTKYYQYSGISKLYLEVGLKQDYQAFNIGYSKDLCLYYQGKLQLVNNEENSNKTFTVAGTSENTSVEDLLNYKNNEIDARFNVLGFGQSNDRTIDISRGYLDTTRFITGSGSNPININYNFIIGYTATITDITTTQSPATTVCALYHKMPNDKYNSEDFGIYKDDIHGYLSQSMFYNGGTSEYQMFGVCKQTNVDGNMLEQCSNVDYIETEAQEIKTPGKLNAGEPLKKMVDYVGKLTFCQPHAHGFSEVNGVNVYDNDGTYGIYSSQSTGIVPTSDLFNKPKYNLSLNTTESLLNYNEFISTLDFNITNGKVKTSALNTQEDIDMPEFIGFTGSQVQDFNKKLLKTMSGVYAYNPDYDFIEINKGDVSIDNKQLSFESNLISVGSGFVFDEGKTLNDYIYLGNMCFSNYLNHLNTHSGIVVNDENSTPLKEVQFSPNLLYCGLNAENPYFLTSLTYNVSTPEDFVSDLELHIDDVVVVKHSDGNSSIIEGTPNPKALYGFDQDSQKLVQLDVSNYTIDNDGVLSLKEQLTVNEAAVGIDNPEQIIAAFSEGGLNFTYTFENEGMTTSTIKANLQYKVEGYSVEIVGSQSTDGGAELLIGVEHKVESISGFRITPEIRILKSSDGDSYQATAYGMSPTAAVVKLLDGSKIRLYDSEDDDLAYLVGQDYEKLDTLVSGSPDALSGIPCKTDSMTYITMFPNSAYWKKPLPDTHRIKFNDYVYTLFPPMSIKLPARFDAECHSEDTILEKNIGDVDLYKLKISRLTVNIARTSSLKSLAKSIIEVTPTAKYASYNYFKYVVNEEYKGAQIKGTSITLNDLVYNPSPTEHRLFVKRGLCRYVDSLQAKIYYRYLNGIEEQKPNHESWNFDDTKYLNGLCMYLGPCFTLDTSDQI